MSGEVVTTLVSMFAVLFAVIGSHFQTMARIDRQTERIDHLTEELAKHSADRAQHR